MKRKDYENAMNRIMMAPEAEHRILERTIALQHERQNDPT
jgi:hypothetical protein